MYIPIESGQIVLFICLSISLVGSLLIGKFFSNK